ncbi:MAG: glycosyltransferase family 39 protein [Ardenticatenales bacterium]|nr:glycosyltransferase family 39 protein [Ardenticatenales bacterium]
MIRQTLIHLRQDRWAAGLALLSLLLGLFSYGWATSHPDYPWDGPILLLASGALLLLALLRLERNDKAAEPWRWRWLTKVPRWRLITIAVSLFLQLLLLTSLLPADKPSYALDVWLWLGSIGTFVLAVAPPVSRPREDWGLWWEINRGVVLLLGLATLVAFGLRVWNLEGIPSTVGGDEGSQGLEALRVLSGEIRNPFTTGWLGVPTMSFFFNSLSIWLMGPTVTALRLPWAIIGTATVLITFWLVTRLRGLPLGLMTAALLATYHYHIHFSRLGSNQIADPFFVSLALLFLYRARDRNSPLDWTLVGIVMGVAQYFYAGARLTVLVVGACTLYFFLTNRERREMLRDLLGGTLTMVGAFVITAGPMIQYALRFPNDYNARLNQVGIIHSGWLEREPAIRGVSMLEVLWDQFLRAFLAFNVYPDRTVWYGSPTPLMEGPWAVLFLLGLFYATLRLLWPAPDHRLFPMVVWWWSGMILGGMLTESPPSSQRLIVLAPPACFFIALVLLRILQFGQEALGQRDLRAVAPVLLTCVLLLGGLSVRWYFSDYTALNVYGSRNGEIATALGKYLRAEVGPEEQVVMIGPPHLYLTFGTIPYLTSHANEGIDILEPLTAPPTLESLHLAAGKEPLFIAIPLRVTELALVEQSFPGGRQFSINDSKGEPLFWVYETNQE